MEDGKVVEDQNLSDNDSFDIVFKSINKSISNNKRNNSNGNHQNDTSHIDVSSDNEYDYETDTETNTSEITHQTEDDFIDDEIRESVFASTVFTGPENLSNPTIGTIVLKYFIEKFANLRKANVRIKELDKEGKLNVIDIFGSPGIKLTQSKQYKGYGTQPFKKYEDFDPTFKKIITTRNRGGYLKYLDQKTGYRPIRKRKATNVIKNKQIIKNKDFIEITKNEQNNALH